MFKNRKKGFSLIELLAVVIILAILALILIPFIGNLIKQAKIQSAVVSAYGYVKAANDEIVAKTTKGEFVDETQYIISNFNIENPSLIVRYEGRGPEKGWFDIYKSKVTQGNFCINGYEIEYRDGVAKYLPDGEFCSPPPRPVICRINSGKMSYEDNTDFEIFNVEDLVCLSELVNSGKTFEGKTITLTNDIDFNNDNSYLDKNAKLEGHDKTIKEEVTTGSGFTPIGNLSNQFKGTFIGGENSSNTITNMYTISNMLIDRASSKDVGLFGYIGQGAVIKNFNLISSKVKGDTNVGGIAGYNSGSIIGINVNNTVTGSTAVGGIAGINHNQGTINEVSVKGTIVGSSSNVGGVAGKNGGYYDRYDLSYGYIYNAVVDADITGTYYVGGITGLGGAGSYSGTYSKDNGAVIGGTITATQKPAAKAIGHREYSMDGLVYTSNTINLVQAASGGPYYQYPKNGNGYDASMHYIGMLDDILDTYYGGDNNNNGTYLDFETDSSDSIVVKKVTDHSFDTTISGSGTESDPYILATEKDFKDASILGKGGYYFKIADNLDISTFKHFFNLGTTNNFFNGKVDGNNKIISNMNLNGGTYSGFISNLNGGNIKNITLKDSTLYNRYGGGSRMGALIGTATTPDSDNIKLSNIVLRNGSNVGTLVGYLNAESNITNVDIDIENQTISAYENIGGVGGSVYGNITFSSLKANGINVTGSGNNVGAIYGILGANCRYEGIDVKNQVIKGANNVGGLIGHNSGSILGVNVENVNVSGTQQIGGLIGYNYKGTINEVTVRGTVTGSSSNVGGIAGQNGSKDGTAYIYNAVVDADVTGTYYVGGMIGLAGAGYYSGIYSTEYGAVTGGTITATQKPAAKAVGHGEYGMNGLVYTSSNATVVQTESGGPYYQYPRNGNGYDANMHYIGMLDEVIDTIYGGDNNNTGYYLDFETDDVDKIVVKKVTEHSFDTTISGTGTEMDPYILATEKDFKDASLLGKGGYYFKIADNLDISTFKHFFNLGTTNNFFNGHIDGNNKIISNMNLNGGNYGGFIGRLNGGSIKNITINNSKEYNRYGSGNGNGILIGNATTTATTNITIKNDIVGGGGNIGTLVGVLNSGSSIKNVDIDIENASISAYENIGGVAGQNNGTITFTNLKANGIHINGSGNNVGAIYGVQGSESKLEISNLNDIVVKGGNNTGGVVGNNAGTITSFDINNLTVNGSESVGGVTGYNSGTISEMNIENVTITGTGSKVGGIAGYSIGTLLEIVFRGTVSGTSSIGGAVGYNGVRWTYGNVYSVLIDADVRGNSDVGGLVGSSSEYYKIYSRVAGVMESGSVTASNGRGAYGSAYYTPELAQVRYLSNIPMSRTSTDNIYDGTSYTSDDANLEYFGSIKYNTNQPLLDSSYTGDVNK